MRGYYPVAETLGSRITGGFYKGEKSEEYLSMTFKDLIIKKMPLYVLHKTKYSYIAIGKRNSM